MCASCADVAVAVCSIDCTSYFELESQEYARRGIQLSPSMWLVKMMVSATECASSWYNVSAGPAR